MPRSRSSYYQGFSLVFRMVEYLNRGKERIEVYVEEYRTHASSIWQAGENRYNSIMLKRAALVISILFSMLSMASASIYSEASSYDPMSAASYYGSFYDVFSNPAALPCLETETGNLSLSLMLSDDWDAGAMAGERMPLLQQQDWDIRASFIARNIALSAFFGTEFARTGADPVYDIYSTLKIQVDVAYAFPHISFGARVTGGNRMIRSERTVDSFTDIFANAWFSPFKRDAGSEFFDLGVGAILEFSPFSAGVYVGKLLTLRNSNIYLVCQRPQRAFFISTVPSQPPHKCWLFRLIFASICLNILKVSSFR